MFTDKKVENHVSKVIDIEKREVQTITQVSLTKIIPRSILTSQTSRRRKQRRRKNTSHFVGRAHTAPRNFEQTNVRKCAVAIQRRRTQSG